MEGRGAASTQIFLVPPQAKQNKSQHRQNPVCDHRFLRTCHVSDDSSGGCSSSVSEGAKPFPIRQLFTMKSAIG